MRKILLASAAFIAATSYAVAADVSITSTVAQDCSVTADAAAVLPSDGTVSAPVDFDFVCNFTGTVATLSFNSLNGGVQDGAGPVYAYNIFSAQGNGDSTDFTTAAIPTVALTPIDSEFTMQLAAGPILIAGNYSDTLTITISP